MAAPIVVPVPPVAAELPRFLCRPIALRMLPLRCIPDLPSYTLLVGVVRSATPAGSYRDRGREASSDRSTLAVTEPASTGADSERVLDSDTSGKRAIVGVVDLLLGSAKPSWLRLKSPSPSVFIAGSFVSIGWPGPDSTDGSSTSG